MVLQRLKRDTHAYHERIERRINLAARLSSRDGYRSVLARFYGFYAPVEAALSSVEGLSLALGDLAARWKTGLIARDLATLGLSARELPALPRCADIPALPDVAHAFGCLYVLEGATLGGQIIARQIVRALGVAADCGGAFFCGYNQETGLMWRSFGAGLAAYATTSEREAMMLLTARETFCAFDRWLEGESV